MMPTAAMIAVGVLRRHVMPFPVEPGWVKKQTVM